MYAQTLVQNVSPIKPNIIKKNNRYKKWEYGYNKEHDVIIISKDGTIGDIIQIQNLVIALPKVPKVVENNNNICQPHIFPKELS